jgi:glycosyltransferase involved in cell wall biosynthesis
MRWHLLTGEYPEQPGGVSDYTALVAVGLASAGDEVHVWAPACSGPTSRRPGVEVHRLPDHLGPRGLARLHAALHARDRLFVQYAPHSFGLKGMNLPLCLWLRHVCPVRPWVMFHEVAFPIVPGQPMRHRLLALAQRRMAALAARAAERVFVSTLAWAPVLARLAPTVVPTWLGVPSNLPESTTNAAVHDARQAVLANEAIVIGHFGSFHPAVTTSVQEALPALLAADPRRLGLFIGLGSQAFAERFLSAHPELSGRVRATGLLPADATVAHLAACDLLIQPYPDGVSARRGSLMAALALGCAVVTTYGESSEPLWRQSGSVPLVPCGDEAALIRAAEALLADESLRSDLAQRGRAFYQAHFCTQRLIATLRREAGLTPPERDAPHGHVA